MGPSPAVSKTGSNPTPSASKPGALTDSGEVACETRIFGREVGGAGRRVGWGGGTAQGQEAGG